MPKAGAEKARRNEEREGSMNVNIKTIMDSSQSTKRSEYLGKATICVEVSVNKNPKEKMKEGIKLYIIKTRMS